MMASSFHQRHRSLIELAIDAAAVDALLARLAVNAEVDPERLSGPWDRLWGRLGEPNHGRIDLLLQSAEDPEMIVSLTMGSGKTTAGSTHDPIFGPVGIRLFPLDDRLPTLAPFVDRYPAGQVVRYRPGKRCTFRIDDDAGARYVKLFPDDRARQQTCDGRQLWQAAKADRLGFAVAAPIGHQPRFGTYTQSEIPGRPAVDELFAGEGAGLAERLGAAAATLVDSGLRVEARHGPNVELRRSERRAADVAAFVPQLSDRLNRLVATLTERTAGLRRQPLQPIHGSPHPNQWLLTESGVALVDFDRLSLGDPELDVATFAAEIDFESVDDRLELNAAFEVGYRINHPDLDPDRLAVYRAHKHLAKVHRTVRAVRGDGDLRAADHLDMTIAELLTSRSTQGVFR